MANSESSEKGGKGGRPRKRPAAQICRELGFEGIEDFLAYMESLHFPYSKGDCDPDPDNFTVRAFPEFPSTAPSEANLRGGRSGLTGRDMRTYFTAYEATYPYHYEMQDDWLHMLADPEVVQYLGTKPAPVPLPFELFELVMLAVADKGNWLKN
ncbi:MAG: hypothetical protein GYA24_20175 [Candidatus Lokiarchaeota archaeon]|nr:hypothetical protein [Candidatus Lokiarchaeota archaeon]